MAVSEILDEIENLVVEGKHIVFTNKSIIEEPDLVRLVDDLRNELPLELQRAEQIMRDKETILAGARKESEDIINRAKDYATHLTEESEIVKQSQEKAEFIMEQVRAQEQTIMTQTMQSAQQLKQDSSQYADDVFAHLINTVSSALQVLQQAKVELNNMEATALQPADMVPAPVSAGN